MRLYNVVLIQSSKFGGKGILIGTPSNPLKNDRFTVACEDGQIRHYTGVRHLTDMLEQGTRKDWHNDYSKGPTGRRSVNPIVIHRDGVITMKGDRVGLIPYVGNAPKKTAGVDKWHSTSPAPNIAKKTRPSTGVGVKPLSIDFKVPKRRRRPIKLDFSRRG